MPGGVIQATKTRLAIENYPALKVEAENLRTEIQVLTQERDTAWAEQLSLENKVSKLTGERDSYFNQIAVMNYHLMAETQEKTKMKTLFERTQDDFERLKQSERDLWKKVENLQQDLSRKEEQIKSLNEIKRSYEKLKQSESELSKKVENLQQDLSRKEEQIKSLIDIKESYEKLQESKGNLNQVHRQGFKIGEKEKTPKKQSQEIETNLESFEALFKNENQFTHLNFLYLDSQTIVNNLDFGIHETIKRTLEKRIPLIESAIQAKKEDLGKLEDYEKRIKEVYRRSFANNGIEETRPLDLLEIQHNLDSRQEINTYMRNKNENFEITKFLERGTSQKEQSEEDEEEINSTGN